MPPSRWLVTRFMASLPNLSMVTVVEKVLLRSCGVARAIPRSEQTDLIGPSRLLTAPPLGPENIKPVASILSMISRTGLDNHTRWLAAFFVPGQRNPGTGLPGMVHHPSLMCSLHIAETSPGR